METTTGKNISNVIEDILLRFDLNISNERGQAYDGAANMSRQYNGCQNYIKQKHPLATYIHCMAHHIHQT